MTGGQRILLTAASALVLSGCAQTGDLAIRAKPTGLAAGEHPVSFRIAEAKGQFALGNVALSLEGFRKALREDPGSVDAMNGIAACYDRMGRFDLSRQYYEMALAVTPSDARLYANLALSLDTQGRKDEAEGIRAELTRRLAASQIAAGPAAADTDRLAGSTATPRSTHAPLIEQPTITTPELNSSAIIPLSASMARRAVSGTSVLPISKPSASVSIALPPADPWPDRPDKAQLERLSLGEVALVTSGPLQWKRLGERHRDDEPAATRSAGASSIGRLTLLNAARSKGLAARTRALLGRGGLHRIAIGNARQVQPSSVITYPESRRAEAVKIASRLGFALQHRPGTDNRLIVYLGRDAATALLALPR